MYETAQKYSELAYYSKQDVAKEMDHYLVEPIWHEIEQYRSLFKVCFPIKGRATYLVRNPFVNNQIAQTQEMLQAYILRHKDEQMQKPDVFWLRQKEIYTFESLFIQLKYQKAWDVQEMFIAFFKQLHLEESISYETCKYLMNPHHNLLLQLFLISMELDKRSAYIIQYPLLASHHALLCVNIWKMEEICDLYDKNGVDFDVTKQFLSFLEHIQLKLSNEMVLLDAGNDNNIQLMQEQELIECYPMLQKEQISFYIAHRLHHHYYTLQDYMTFHNVCYETARYSMEKLVALHWYQKAKIGKKFVYYII